MPVEIEPVAEPLSVSARILQTCNPLSKSRGRQSPDHSDGSPKNARLHREDVCGASPIGLRCAPLDAALASKLGNSGPRTGALFNRQEVHMKRIAFILHDDPIGSHGIESSDREIGRGHGRHSGRQSTRRNLCRSGWSGKSRAARQIHGRFRQRRSRIAGRSALRQHLSRAEE